jgi:hypothetical protein
MDCGGWRHGRVAMAVRRVVLAHSTTGISIQLAGRAAVSAVTIRTWPSRSSWSQTTLLLLWTLIEWRLYCALPKGVACSLQFLKRNCIDEVVCASEQ